MTAISEALQREICDYLQGTSKGEYEAAEAFGVTDDEVLEAVVAVGEIERCDSCSWWCEVHELDDALNCSDCREEGDE